METIEKLAAMHEIMALKARYFRSIDTKDWEGLRQVFATDGALDVSDTGSVRLSGGTGIHNGVDAIIAMASAALGSAKTVHHGHNPEIVIDSATEAHGIWAYEDIIVKSDEAGTRKIQGYGHYRDRYVKVDGAWRIALTKVSRLYLESTGG